MNKNNDKGYEALGQKVFELDNKVATEDQIKGLMDYIMYLIKDIPEEFKASDENTRVIMRVFTKRC